MNQKVDLWQFSTEYYEESICGVAQILLFDLVSHSHFITFNITAKCLF